MDENAMGSVDLNTVEQDKIALEQAKRELYEVKIKLNTLDLPSGFKTISIGKYGKLKVSERIEERDVIELELENEEQERQIQLYKELEGKRLLLIGTINEKEQIVLSEEYKQFSEERYKGYIDRKELDEPYTVEREEMGKQKATEISPEEEPELEQQNYKTSKTSEEIEIARMLGIPQSQILNVVEIKDEDAMSNALNKNLENKRLFAVKLRTSAGKLTSNEWVMVQEDSKGDYERAMREDPSDTLQAIGHELGIKSTRQNDTIKDGEISAEATPYDDSIKHIEIRRHRYTDGNTYVMEVDAVNEAVLHVYKEENGKLVPLCKEEHGHHEHEEIELPDRKLEVEEEKEEDESEERTPWGDAESRRNRY